MKKLFNIAEHEKINPREFKIFTMKSLGFTLLTTTVWLIANYFSWFDGEIRKDEQMVTGGQLMIIGIIYAIILGKGMDHAIPKVKKSAAITRKIKALSGTDSKEIETLVTELQQIKDDQISFPIIRLPLIILSFFIFTGIFVYPFASVINGIHGISSTSFLLYFFYAILMDMEDPTRGIFTADIPNELLQKIQNIS